MPIQMKKNRITSKHTSIDLDYLRLSALLMGQGHVLGTSKRLQVFNAGIVMLLHKGISDLVLSTKDLLLLFAVCCCCATQIKKGIWLILHASASNKRPITQTHK